LIANLGAAHTPREMKTLTRTAVFAASTSVVAWYFRPAIPSEENKYVDDSSTPQSTPFHPFVVGENNCQLIQAYFPKDALEELLPNQLSIPNDVTMAKYYPDTLLKPEAHPFLMAFCHGSKIHDVDTNMYVPEQEEVMFMFPVVTRNDNLDYHLCSYVPVLYLDSFIGVLGGLVFGLRKEYHPAMKHGKSKAARFWRLEGTFNASFEIQHENGDLEQLPHFMEQTYLNPFVTVSYPMPFAKTAFYHARVYPRTIISTTEEFHWNYKGTVVSQSDDTQSVYVDYGFTMSKPMTAREFWKVQYVV